MKFVITTEEDIAAFETSNSTNKNENYVCTSEWENPYVNPRKPLGKIWVNTIREGELTEKAIQSYSQVTGLGATQQFCGHMSETQSKVLEKTLISGSNSC